MTFTSVPHVPTSGDARTTLQEGTATPTFDTPGPISEAAGQAPRSRGPRSATSTARSRCWWSCRPGRTCGGDTAKGEYVVEGADGSYQLKTASGKAIVDHVTGQADMSGNRDIRTRQLGGGAVVKNLGGDRWAGEVAGDLRVNSANGHVIVDVAHAAVNAHTGSGDIRVGKLVSGTADLCTATGEVAVGIPRGPAAELDAHTTAGRVRNHLEGPEQPDRTAKVRARSHGGDITVRRA